MSSYDKKTLMASMYAIKEGENSSRMGSTDIIRRQYEAVDTVGN